MSAPGASKASWQRLVDAGLTADLLPVVCDRTVPISPRSKLTALGKVPSGIDADGCAQGFKNWTSKVATEAEIEAWSGDDRLGICLQTRMCKVFDVDVEDKALADRVEGLLRPLIAELAEVPPDRLPLRLRDNSSKFAMIVRCDAVLPKRVIELGGTNKIEFLGNGQQAMIAGTHPTGSRIEWQLSPAEAPSLTADQIEMVWRELQEEFGALPSTVSVFDAGDFTAGREPPLGLSVGQIEELLSYIDPDCVRDEWIQIGMALHHETGGDDTGLAFWDEWSSQGSKYHGHEHVEYQWRSFRGLTPGRRSVTMASVIKLAKEGGYVPRCPSEPLCEPSVPVQVPVLAPVAGRQVQLPAPFPGFMADVVSLALATANKRQPDMTLLGVLIAMAAACGSQVGLPDGMRLNLYGLGVAPTSSGKDHVLHVCGAIARAAGAFRLGDLASGAGLEDALREGGMLASIDEIAHVLAARADRGTQHLREVERMLLKLFSASKGEYITRAKAGLAPRVVKNPALNLIGFAVPAKLGEALTDGDVASGLLNRMLVAVGDGAARPEPGPRQMFELDASMLSRLDAVALSPGLIAFSSEAEQRVEDLKLELYEVEQALPEEAAERLLRGRTLEKALRIAGVLAVFDKPASPKVETAHLDWALDVARASDVTLIDFLNRHMHGGKVQADAASVANIARGVLAMAPSSCRPSEASALAAGYVPISVLAKRSRLDVKAMNEAISLLEMRGEMARAHFMHTPVAGRQSKCATLYFTSAV